MERVEPPEPLGCPARQVLDALLPTMGEIVTELKTTSLLRNAW
jgi:hypothetical protein